MLYFRLHKIVAARISIIRERFLSLHSSLLTVSITFLRWKREEKGGFLTHVLPQAMSSTNAVAVTCVLF